MEDFDVVEPQFVLFVRSLDVKNLTRVPARVRVVKALVIVQNDLTVSPVP
jgi:hypothetical protein